MQYGIGPMRFKFTVDRKLEGGESYEIEDGLGGNIYTGSLNGGIALSNLPKKILIPAM
jgi:hypothetical protein